MGVVLIEKRLIQYLLAMPTAAEQLPQNLQFGHSTLVQFKLFDHQAGHTHQISLKCRVESSQKGLQLQRGSRSEANRISSYAHIPSSEYHGPEGLMAPSTACDVVSSLQQSLFCG